MEFQVSARKWRPQKFSELVGQEHIVRTLVNGIEMNRVAHAYLFSGTRGVGKTTSARILAKALNCQNRNGSEPCDACSPCLEIKQGTCLDVQEIDGASNNGVAEVRDLVENIQYAAPSCPARVLHGRGCKSTPQKPIARECPVQRHAGQRVTTPPKISRASRMISDSAI